MENPIKILVIDDEDQIRRFLKISLEAQGFNLFEAATARDGLIQAAMQRPDLVILDLGLPDGDGLDTLKKLREWAEMPVIVLSVRDAEEDKIALLDAGADDYLTKPFSAGELIARIRVALRHASPAAKEGVFKDGPLEVDLPARAVRVSDRPVKLTATEYDLLRMFVRHAGKVLTHHQILKEIWGSTSSEEMQYLRVYISHLRRKIENDPANPRLILTETGVGYRLHLQPAEPGDGNPDD
jgi:two-component system, OmpR family, KDP operon response regulator KdpE